MTEPGYGLYEDLRKIVLAKAPLASTETERLRNENADLRKRVRQMHDFANTTAQQLETAAKRLRWLMERMEKESHERPADNHS